MFAVYLSLKARYKYIMKVQNTTTVLVKFYVAENSDFLKISFLIPSHCFQIQTLWIYSSQFNPPNLSFDLTLNFWFYNIAFNCNLDTHVDDTPSFLDFLQSKSDNCTFLSDYTIFCSIFPNHILLNLELFESFHSFTF